jgi:kynureninase
VITGWYSEFELLESRATGAVPYGEGPARFAGSTYDPTSHYRAAPVFRFFEDQGLTPERLRELNQHQVAHLERGLDELGLPPKLIARPKVKLDRIGGFLALKAPKAIALSRALRVRGIFADARHDILRLGPAPYVTDGQLDQALIALAEVAGETPAH